ncbi:MAG: glutaredoxin family protein [Ignavibacteria bacterium]|nr:glutaredoxin family protein [Ignavibacteria bacterium]
MKPKIELFTTSNCQNCRIAKIILEQYGHDFIEKNIELNSDYRREFEEKTNGQLYVPTLVINDNVYINIKPHELLELVKHLKS